MSSDQKPSRQAPDAGDPGRSGKDRPGTDSLSEDQLVQQARALDQSGNSEAAAACCKALLERNPRHRFALSLLANLALRSGQMREAVALCQQAVAAAPQDAVLQMNLGMTLIRAGQREAALTALARATALKPELGVAHLYAGALLQEAGQPEAALAAWCNAFEADPRLRQAYRSDALGAEIKQLSLLANGALRDEHRRRHDRAVAPFREQMDDAARQRLDAFLEHFHGYRQHPWADPLQKPTYMYYPGLPARPWFEREEFDWVAGLEGDAEAIADECFAVMREATGLKPYLDHIPSAPAQMGELMGSLQWSSYHLLAQGREVAEHCQACPSSLAALQRMPLPVGENQSPEAFFSILKADTHIPPHFGVSNTKIVVHLALKIPDQCGLRAGSETRHWTPGQCLIFDDSFEHEAWNRSEDWRAVLITEVWHPGLSAPECQALEAVLAASARWQEFQQQPG